MTAVFATLGFTPAKVMPSIQARDGVEEVVLFHDRDPRSIEAAAAVARSLDDAGVPHREVPVDAFDVAESARAIKAELVRHRGTPRVFNISGGTRVLSAAALLAAIVEGVRVVYTHEREGREVALPLMSIRYESLLNEAKRRVLSHVRDHPGCTQTQVATGLGLTRGTVSHHVQELVALGLVEASPMADARKEALHLIPTADLLLEPELGPPSPSGRGPRTA